MRRKIGRDANGVHALALLIPAALALVVVPWGLRELRTHDAVRPNYRGAQLPWPAGVLIVLAALLSLLVLAPLQQLDSDGVFHPQMGAVALYLVGVALLGLLDDLLGQRFAGAPRGIRAHARAAVRGRLSTGTLKALGTSALALYCASTIGSHPPSAVWWLLASAVLVLATHAFNLLDLRPGRAPKALVLLGAGLTVAAGPRAPYTLGLFLGPALVLGACDLRERALVGDSGAAMFGGLAGWWLVLTLSSVGMVVALVLLSVICLYGELRSISAAVERLPLLRHLDSIGRPP